MGVVGDYDLKTWKSRDIYYRKKLDFDLKLGVCAMADDLSLCFRFFSQQIKRLDSP